MYHQYFGLNEAPFSIAVNPRYLFMSARHRDALAHLLYGVGAGGGFILLTGEVGTGKTTINRCLLEQLPDDTDVAIILNPALNALELLASACDEFGIEYDAKSHSLKTLTDQLHAFLLANHGRGRNTVLMIDEAQHLDFDVLEQIRLLTNLETNNQKLLQIILIGQPELAQLLNRPELRQLNQRITARYNLEPLNLDETRAYIRHRLEVAGLAPGREIFPDSVVRALFKKTRGIPRLINIICDRMLLGAYGQNALRVDRKMLESATKEVMGDVPDNRIGAWRRGVIVALLSLFFVGIALGAKWWVDISPNELAPVASAPAVQTETTARLTQLDDPVAPRVSPEWLLGPDQALSLLWSLNSPQPMPADVCVSESHFGVFCVVDRVQAWSELQYLDRPIILDMITPERFLAGVVLLDIQGRSALIMVGDGMVELSLASLAASWTGGYRYLWRPPSGFSRPLSIGDNSAVVAEVALLFAQLDGQQEALAHTVFSESLETRVKLFQRQYKLLDDGVVGVQTLLKLNELLGIDINRAKAKTMVETNQQELWKP